MKPTSVFALAIVITSTWSFAADLSHSDKSFITDAYQGNLSEIKAGEMAQNKTANEDVKAFATQMVTDHTKANSDLKTLADSKNVTVPTDVSLIEKGKAKLLDAKSGADFDKAYAEAMVSDHKKDVAMFEKVAGEGKDAEVKAFAAQLLYELHTQAARTLCEEEFAWLSSQP